VKQDSLAQYGVYIGRDKPPDGRPSEVNFEAAGHWPETPCWDINAMKRNKSQTPESIRVA